MMNFVGLFSWGKIMFIPGAGLAEVSVLSPESQAR